MSNTVDIKNSILKAVDTIAMRRIDQLNIDKTVVAIIKESVGRYQGKKVYKVFYEGGYFNATVQNDNDAYLPEMAVYVSIPQGDFSNEKFIIGKASNISNASQAVVTAVANDYSIIGNNILKNKVNKIGLKSYHDPKIEESKNTDSIFHRYNQLYNVNKPNESSKSVDINIGLNVYKTEATAFMIRADFMTKLSSDQRRQATGEYGIVFNLVFKNLAMNSFKTQGEAFTYYAKKITNKISIQEGNTPTEVTLLELDSNLTKEKLSTRLGYIKALIESYDQKTQEMKDVLNSYVQNLEDIINTDNFNLYNQ